MRTGVYLSGWVNKFLCITVAAVLILHANRLSFLHVLLQTVYTHRPRQLGHEDKAVVENLLHLKSGKKLIQLHISERTGKVMRLHCIYRSTSFILYRCNVQDSYSTFTSLISLETI